MHSPTPTCAPPHSPALPHIHLSSPTLSHWADPIQNLLSVSLGSCSHSMATSKATTATKERRRKTPSPGVLYIRGKGSWESVSSIFSSFRGDGLPAPPYSSLTFPPTTTHRPTMLRIPSHRMGWVAKVKDQCAPHIPALRGWGDRPHIVGAAELHFGPRLSAHCCLPPALRTGSGVQTHELTVEQGCSRSCLRLTEP